MVYHQCTVLFSQKILQRSSATRVVCQKTSETEKRQKTARTHIQRRNQASYRTDYINEDAGFFGWAYEELGPYERIKIPFTVTAPLIDDPYLKLHTSQTYHEMGK